MPETHGPAQRRHQTRTAKPKARPKARIDAVDILRGVALLGMIAVHSLIIFNKDGSPTFVTEVAAGRSFSIFAVLAGVSLALMTGGSRPVDALRMKARSAGIAARGVYIAIVGSVAGYLTTLLDVHFTVILVYYGVMFLLAVPLLRLSTRVLAIAAVVSSLVVPFVIYLLRPSLQHTDSEQETLVDLFMHPIRFFSEIFVVGSYPVFALIVLLMGGLVIGRLNLRDKAVAIRLTVVGTTMAVVSWVSSGILLFQFGGQDALFSNHNMELDNEVTKTTVMWWPQESSATPWELAQRIGHTNTTFDFVHSIGVTAALLGVLLLVTRAEIVRRLLSPLGAAGSMPLTIYTMQIFLLAAWKFELSPYSLYYYAMAVFVLAFATVWRAKLGRGFLERGAVVFARSAANRTMKRLETSYPGPSERSRRKTPLPPS